MKHSEKCVTEHLWTDYNSNPKASGSTGKSSFTMPPMQGIDQLMLLSENLNQQRINPTTGSRQVILKICVHKQPVGESPVPRFLV